MLSPFVWPAVVLVAAVATSAGVWVALRRYRPSLTASGCLGLFVVFGQTLDGLSTLVAVDVLSFTERVAASRAVLAFAGDLPVAPVLGTGWLFVLVKLGLALVLVSLVRPELEESPAVGRALLFVAGSVGFLPGASNLLRFLAV
ncbi:DUF63 family protein [Halomarina litorea]|uniref:DUF63 family protein n=1 Tax=Halomarina litorea TaxID=2961595 RepID=UPI0020C2AFBD|nr:DUF63 family protein [Halomarina sp. BCD28]